MLTLYCQMDLLPGGGNFLERVFFRGTNLKSQGQGLIQKHEFKSNVETVLTDIAHPDTQLVEMNHLLHTYAEKTKSVPGVNIHLNIVTNSRVLFHDGSLLHSKFSTQLLITGSYFPRILIHAQLPLVF
jgi:hypothetical protein